MRQSQFRVSASDSMQPGTARIPTGNDLVLPSGIQAEGIEQPGNPHHLDRPQRHRPEPREHDDHKPVRAADRNIAKCADASFRLLGDHPDDRMPTVGKRDVHPVRERIDRTTRALCHERPGEGAHQIHRGRYRTITRRSQHLVVCSDKIDPRPQDRGRTLSDAHVHHPPSESMARGCDRE